MIIWESKLDEIYDCKVTRISENKGKLTIVDQFNRPLFDREVGLLYGALFGPDIDDVLYWEELCVQFIDKLVEG